jgi:hypothetical protein
VTIIFNGDLSPGNLSQYPLNQMCKPDRATVYSADSQPSWPKPPADCKNAVRFHVLNSDVAPCTPTNNPRAQVSSGKVLAEGSEIWWRLAMFFPVGFPAFNGAWYLFQEDYGEPWNGSPPTGFGVVNDQLIISRSPAYGYDWIWSKALHREHWYEFLVHKKMSRSKTGGFIEMWVDGVQQTFAPRPYGRPAPNAGVPRLTMQTMHGDASGAYRFFINSYRKAGSVSAAVDTFYAGMKVATTQGEVMVVPTSQPPAPEPPVAADAPTAVFTPPAVVNLPVRFDATGSRNAVAYEWDLDGVSKMTGPTPEFTFKNPGTKRVTLTVTAADGQKATVTHDIVVV